MSLFKKKKENADVLALLRRLDGRTVTRFVQRDPHTYEETILGRSGAFSVKGDTLIISCENTVWFRHPLKEIKAYELMNLSGVCLNVGSARYIAYYSDGRIGKK